MTEQGLTVALSVNQLLTMVTQFLAPTLKDKLGGYTFILCAGFSLLAGLFFLFFLKETKGLSEKQVAKLYVPEGYVYSDG